MAQRLQLVQDLAEIIGVRAFPAPGPPGTVTRRPSTCATRTGPQPSLVVTDWQAGGRLAGCHPVDHRRPFDRPRRASSCSSTTRSAATRLPRRPPRADVPGIHAGRVLSRRARLPHLQRRRSRGHAGRAGRRGTRQRPAPRRGRRRHAVQPGRRWSTTPPAATRCTGSRPASPEFRERVGRGLGRADRARAGDRDRPAVRPTRATCSTADSSWSSRLGTGATAIALLVTAATPAARETLVLKVARDEQYAERLGAEARALRRAEALAGRRAGRRPGHRRRRTALVLESAGEPHPGRRAAGRTPAPWTCSNATAATCSTSSTSSTAEGVWHRDLKPANLAARPRRRDKQPHLCVFDFSLAATPVDQIQAGTAALSRPVPRPASPDCATTPRPNGSPLL